MTPANPNTAPAHPHYCPCPSASEHFPCIRPCLNLTDVLKSGGRNEGSAEYRNINTASSQGLANVPNSSHGLANGQNANQFSDPSSKNADTENTNGKELYSNCFELFQSNCFMNTLSAIEWSGIRVEFKKDDILLFIA